MQNPGCFPNNFLMDWLESFFCIDWFIHTWSHSLGILFCLLKPCSAPVWEVTGDNICAWCKVSSLSARGPAYTSLAASAITHTGSNSGKICVNWHSPPDNLSLLFITNILWVKFHLCILTACWSAANVDWICHESLEGLRLYLRQLIVQICGHVL